MTFKLIIVMLLDLMFSAIAYYLIGIVTLSHLDKKDGITFKWYKSAPNAICQFTVIMIWPVLAYKTWRRNK